MIRSIKLQAVDTKSSNTSYLGEYSEHLMVYSADIEKISREVFGDVTIGSQEFLFNLDESPDFIYVDFTNYGYAVFAAESLELLEFAAQGSLPYQNTRGRRYYNGPKGYYTKINEQFVNEVTYESFVISASEAKEYSRTIRQTFSIGERELKVESEEKNDELTVRAAALSRNNTKIDTDNFIEGISISKPTYINNKNYFLANPMHKKNVGGICGSVAAQLLLSYNNYYNDRRIIAPKYLNGGWHNATGNNNINDPLNYTIPSHDPNACADPMLMTRETTGSNDAFSKVLEDDIELLVGGSTRTRIRNGMRDILDGRNISHSTDAHIINSAEDIKAQINSRRPVIIGMRKRLGGANHFVVGYGYGNYTYGAGQPFGYIVHYGWTDSINIWINSKWCFDYITMQINHTHTYVSTGTFHNGKIILRCNTCKHRKTEANNIFASGKGTPDDPFIITTASHLNNVRDYYSRYFKLGNDIDLQNVQWTPIPSFEGTFEGNGKTIRNLKMVYSPANSSGYGLFINNNNTIQNLKVTANINFQNYTSGYVEIAISVGVIAVNNYGVIYSCQVSASSGDPMIYCKTGFTGTVGGITARNFGAINRSDNNGIIYSSGNTGGIAGYNGNSIMTCNNNALICYSYVDNRITKTHSIGGIAGTNYSSISNVTNTAMILYGGYSQLNDNQLQPRMAHITGSNFGTINNSSWHGGSVNKGLLINYSWTQSGVTYTHDQALYVRSAATGL